MTESPTHPLAGKPQMHAEQEKALIQEILNVLRLAPRRTAVTVGALMVLLRGTALQLPPDGIRVVAVAVAVAEMAGDLMQAASQAHMVAPSHLPASTTTH